MKNWVLYNQSYSSVVYKAIEENAETSFTIDKELKTLSYRSMYFVVKEGMWEPQAAETNENSQKNKKVDGTHHIEGIKAMAEYIDRTELEPDTEWSEYYDDFVSYSQSQINGSPTADVIERSEYEYLKKENRELAIKYDNAMNMVINEQENVTRLRGKIDKAIEESYKKGLTDAWECARKIGNNSQLGLEEMGFDFSELGTYYNPSWWVVFNYDVFKALEILKRNIEGE